MVVQANAEATESAASASSHPRPKLTQHQALRGACHSSVATPAMQSYVVVAVTVVVSIHSGPSGQLLGSSKAQPRPAALQQYACFAIDHCLFQSDAPRPQSSSGSGSVVVVEGVHPVPLRSQHQSRLSAGHSVSGLPSHGTQSYSAGASGQPWPSRSQHHCFFSCGQLRRQFDRPAAQSNDTSAVATDEANSCVITKSSNSRREITTAMCTPSSALGFARPH